MAIPPTSTPSPTSGRAVERGHSPRTRRKRTEPPDLLVGRIPAMRVSEGVEWAAHCAVLLSFLPDKAVLPAGRLAEYYGIPSPDLAKSLQAMADAGIVTPSPGRYAGYRLSRPASEITLLDIVVAVEGDDPLFACTEIRRRGPSRVAGQAYMPLCSIAAAMGRAEVAWRNELMRMSIAELAAGMARQEPPQALNKSAAWLRRVLPPGTRR